MQKVLLRKTLGAAPLRFARLPIDGLRKNALASKHFCLWHHKNGKSCSCNSYRLLPSRTFAQLCIEGIAETFVQAHTFASQTNSYRLRLTAHHKPSGKERLRMTHTAFADVSRSQKSDLPPSPVRENPRDDFRRPLYSQTGAYSKP